MIIVQETYVCKPGNASKVAKLFKDAFADYKSVTNIVTDMTGQFNRVIVFSQYDSLTAYEKSWKDYSPEEMKKMQEKMKGYTEMYQTGGREIFQVW